MVYQEKLGSCRWNNVATLLEKGEPNSRRLSKDSCQPVMCVGRVACRVREIGNNCLIGM
jgi:hypothetical protein